MFLNACHSRRGQGLLEVIIGIGVIVAGTVGTITLISSTVLAGRTVSQKVVAASLAREGIETIRNARDTNWLRIQANEDTVPLTLGIQLPPTFDSIFNESVPWHNVVPEFDRSVNGWLVSALNPVPNPVTLDTNCIGTTKCSQVFLDNNGYYQDTTPALGASQSRFRRLVTLNPICRRDFDADGIPDVGTSGNTLATETIVTIDDGSVSNSTCVTPFMLVGLQVVSTVCWDDCAMAKTFTLEDRLYNWKYVK